MTSELTQNFHQTENKKTSNSYIDVIKYIWGYTQQYQRSMLKIMLLMLVITIFSALLPIITQSIIDVGIPTKDQIFITLMPEMMRIKTEPALHCYDNNKTKFFILCIIALLSCVYAQGECF